MARHTACTDPGNPSKPESPNVSAQAPAAASATAASKKKTGGARKWLWIIVACLVIGGSGGGWWWWQARNAPVPEKTVGKLPAQYFAIEPAFVVNLADQEAVRYLQADVQLMTRDVDTRAALELHAPAIRNRLLLLFSQQSAAQLTQRSAKERLQEKALAEVTQVLKAESAPAKVEAVLFTSLVTQ